MLLSFLSEQDSARTLQEGRKALEQVCKAREVKHKDGLATAIAEEGLHTGSGNKGGEDVGLMEGLAGGYLGTWP